MIDIIIPCINPPQDLTQAINSILDTTSNLSQIHIYVISDASKYNYEELINNYSQKVNITLIKSEKRIGPGPARNLGIKAGENPYISFLDADDKFQADILKYCDNNYDVISTSIQSFDFISHKIERLYSSKEKIASIHGLIVSRKLIFDTNLYFPEIKYASEDTIFRSVLLSLPNISIKHINNSFYEDLDNPNSLFRHNLFFKEYEEERQDEAYYHYEMQATWLYLFYNYLCTLNLNKEIINSKQWHDNLLTLCFWFCNLTDVNCILLIALIVNKFIINPLEITFNAFSIEDLAIYIFIVKYLYIESNYIIFYPKFTIEDYKNFLVLLNNNKLTLNFYNLILIYFNHYQKKFFSIDALFAECNFYYYNKKQKSDIS